MKFKTKNSAIRLNKYDLFIALLVVVAVLIIAGIWMWYGYKNQELEREIYKLK